MTMISPSASRSRDEPDPHAATALLTVSVLLVFLAPAAVFLGGLSWMATDSCGPDNCPADLMRSLDVISAMFSYGGPFTFAALVTAWSLPRTRRWAAARAWAAVTALLPALTVLFLVLTLPPS
jgi:hypothetical protein